MERNVERLFNGFHDMICVATSRVGPEYFQLAVANSDTVYRERVYCYELYHQLRCLWGDFPLSLGGEVDKRGHPFFDGGPYALAKPDFLVHTPGDMEENLAAVEVKPATANLAELRSDLRKVSWFCQNVRYFRGVLLVYGDAGDEAALAATIRLAGRGVPGVDLAVVACLYHRFVGQPAIAIHP